MSAPVDATRSNQQQLWENYDAILRTAERSRALGDLSRARTFFARLVELDPKDARGWVGMAMTAQSLDERIISWGYALAITPNGWEARIQLDAYIEERIAASSIGDAPVLIALGRTLAEMGQRPSAHRLLARATDLNPTNIDGWLWRSGASDDANETLKCLQQALAIEPNNEQAKAGLAWALQKQGELPRTVSDSNSTKAHEDYDEGQRAFQAGDLESAHIAFKRATDINPLDAQAWFWRGSTASNTEHALVCMEQTLKLNPQHTGAKDAQWWLRVKKFWENYPAIKPPPSPLVTPDTRLPDVEISHPSARQRYLLGFLAIAAVVVMSIAIGIWIVVAR